MRLRLTLILLLISAGLCLAQDMERTDATDAATMARFERIFAQYIENLASEGAGEALVRFKGREEPDHESSSTWPNPESYTYFKFSGELSRSDEHFYDVKSGAVGRLRSVYVDAENEVLRYAAHQSWATIMKRTDIAHSDIGEDFRPEGMFSFPVSPEAVLRNTMAMQRFSIEELENGMVKLTSADTPSYVLFDPAEGCMLKEFSLQTLPYGYRNQHTTTYKCRIEYERTSKGWYPRTVDATEVEVAETEEGRYTSEKNWVIEVTRFDPEAAIDESEFTLESMGIAVGTPVWAIPQRQMDEPPLYHYGKGPLPEEDVDSTLAELASDVVDADAGSGASPREAVVARDASSREAAAEPADGTAGGGSRRAAWYLAIVAVLAVFAVLLYLRTGRSAMPTGGQAARGRRARARRNSAPAGKPTTPWEKQRRAGR